jgi:hypothetical protein
MAECSHTRGGGHCSAARVACVSTVRPPAGGWLAWVCSGTLWSIFVVSVLARSGSASSGPPVTDRINTRLFATTIPENLTAHQRARIEIAYEDFLTCVPEAGSRSVRQHVIWSPCAGAARWLLGRRLGRCAAIDTPGTSAFDDRRGIGPRPRCGVRCPQRYSRYARGGQGR